MKLNRASLQDVKVQLDAQIKRLLAQKIVLAWILKRNVTEFTEMDLEGVLACIEGDPQIGTKAVNPGETNSQITGMKNEDTVPGEGTLYYDIVFYVRIPGETDITKMIINVEAQRRFSPGYHIETRAVFYAAREISAQKNTEFEGSDYDSIKKVYSIWICTNAPAYIGNAISEYSFYKNDYIPGIPDRKNAYDKIAIIIVALNESVDCTDPFIGMMNTLVSTRISVDEKKRRLQDVYGIPVSSEFEGGLNDMCNFADSIAEEYFEEGVQSGFLKGELSGFSKGEISGFSKGESQKGSSIVRRMLLSGKYSREEIADITEFSIDRIMQIEDSLSVTV